MTMDLNAPGSARRPATSKSMTSAYEGARFRPWEQQDLLHRLHTFKTRTWFGKPSQINALVCARHGWTNSGPDTLACECCGESLELYIRPKWSLADVDKAARDYSNRLVSGHAASCLWRDTVCETSLGRFPKLPARDVYLKYHQRYNSLSQLSALPAIHTRCLSLFQKTHRQQLEAVLERQLQGTPATSSQQPQPTHAASSLVAHQVQEHGTDAFTQRACLLASCGWEPFFITNPPASSLDTGNAAAASSSLTSSMPPGTREMHLAALSCGMCGAKVGLWSITETAGQAEQRAATHDDTPGPSTDAQEASSTATDSRQKQPASRRPSAVVDLSRTIAGGSLDKPATSSKQAHQPAAVFGSASLTPAFGSGSASITPAFGSGSASLTPAFGGGPSTSASFTPAFGNGPSTPAFGSSRAAATGSHETASFADQAQDSAVFGSGATAPAFGSGLHAPAFGSGSGAQPFGSAAAPFGNGLHRPAFGSGSRLSFAAVSGSGNERAGMGSPAITVAAKGTPAGQKLDAQEGRLVANTAKEAVPSSSVERQAHLQTPPGSAGASGAFGSAEEGPFGSAASMPAFGMAVLRSPPTSPSPSLQGSRSNSMTPATAAPTNVAQPGSASWHVPIEAAGSKRKRVTEHSNGVVNGVANGEATGNLQGAKQPRLQSGDVDWQAGDGSAGADADELAFKALAHHRSFCPWVNTEQPDAAVCGWQWCLESLADHWGHDSTTEVQPVQTPSKRLQRALAAIGK